MGDVDAGNVKAKASIEYDPSGLSKMKDDLKSLPDMLGELGESTGGASDELSGLDKQMGNSAKSAGSFSDAIEELPKIFESGEASVSSFNDTLSEQQSVIADTGAAFEEMQKPIESTFSSLEKASPSMTTFSKNAESMVDSFGAMGDTWGVAGNNIQAFQEAIASPDSFQVIDDHLAKTGQFYEDFASSLGQSDHQLLHQMSNDWVQTNSFLDESGRNFANLGKSANEGFSAVSASAADANKAVSDFLGVGEEASKAKIGGESWWSGEAEGLFGGGGLMGILNDVAMPLMAVQMIGAAIGTVGQGIYDAAAIAEGPGAHGFGSFTGAVDTLNYSIQKTGQSYAENFGQGMLPGLNGLNNGIANNPDNGTGDWIMKGLGMEAGLGTDILSIAGGGILGGAAKILTMNPANTFGNDWVQGGMHGLQNYWADWTGQPEPYGPPPVANANPMQGQIDQMNALANNPEYLAAQTHYSSAMAKAQQAQASWDTSHYTGTYGPSDPMNEVLQAQAVRANGGTYGTVHNDPLAWTYNLGLEGTIPGGGCFVAGTQVSMANGTKKAIEQLQIGEKVLAHDDIDQDVVTTILALIKPPPKMVYALQFDDGNTLTLTDSHPVASLQGWKALSVEHAKQENPDLVISTLEIGDMVVTGSGTSKLVAIHQGERVQVYNITVDEPHTFYAGGVLVHNKSLGSMSNSGVGSEQVAVSHTFTAQVTWEAQNLEKSFTASAQWAEQGLMHQATAVANWAEQNVIHPVTAAAQWAEQNVMHAVTAAAQWADENITHPVVAAAQWADENLIHPVTAAAQWAEQGLEHLFTGKASWIGQGLDHLFTATANWSAQNLNPTFTVHPSVTMLAEGTSNWGGGAAIVGEAGTEVVESNGQYSLFNQGATLVDLPPGSSVYPMKNLTTSSVAQFADGTGGDIIPLQLGVAGGNIVLNVTHLITLDSRVIAEETIPHIAPMARVAGGMRGY